MTDELPQLSPAQQDALIASVSFPANSPAYGVVLRGGAQYVRALPQSDLLRLRHLGLVAEWRTTEGALGSDVSSVKLNPQGIELALGLAADARAEGAAPIL